MQNIVTRCATSSRLGVTVFVLMPGATETSFFELAHLLDTQVGAGEKAAEQSQDGRAGECR